MRMFCFGYLCGEYNPQTEGTMANVEFSGRIAWIYKQNALLLVVERKIFTYSGAYPFSIPGLQSAVRSAKIGSF